VFDGPHISESARIALLSLHQRDAAVDVRERFAASVARVTGSDVLVLATCHRCEVALVVPPGDDPERWIAERLGVAALPAEAGVRLDRDAVLHFTRVACGLDSVIRGEGQILGQLRRAFDEARASTPLDPLLAIVVQRVLGAGRELRRSTALGSVRRTVGSLAVDAALAGLDGDATVLVVGAGEVGKLTLRALASRARTVVVANRDLDRATSLAREHGATAVALEAIDEPLGRADAVIAAADTRGAVLTADRLRRRLARGALTLVDLAVPRSVHADARDLPGLRYLDVDDLSDAAAPELDASAVRDVEERCAAVADAIVAELRERQASPTIRALRERAEAIRRTQLERALARLGHLSARDRRVVESLSEGLAHALIHEPTVRLRRSPEHEPAARDLFAL
jgi:glutamyl-tRNA reductase